MTKQTIYETITNEVIQQLLSVDLGSWNKPWFDIKRLPYNAVTGNTYRGINTFLLSFNDYDIPAYATYKQWASKGCQVNKGSKASLSTFYKTLRIEDKLTGEEKDIPFLRKSAVFNVSQVEGEYAREIEANFKKPLNTHESLELAENVINNYKRHELIEYRNGDRACYSPTLDIISMPLLGQFESSEDYYSTFFHEIAHSTGHEKRLDRKLLSYSNDRESYAKEELVAELSASIACALYGISNKPRKDHAQYIKSWLEVLQNDSRLVVQAASKAQKAVDYIDSAHQAMVEYDKIKAA